MVADGRNLWFYDRDLEQVSVKPASSAITATPAGLLSGEGNIRELFTVSAAGRKDGLDWVLVTPKESDADFREARLAFGKSEAQAHGAQGQTRADRQSRIRDQRAQSTVAEAEVKFTPPPECGRHRHSGEMNLQRVWWALGVILLAAAVYVCLTQATAVIRCFEVEDKTSQLWSRLLALNSGHSAFEIVVECLRRGCSVHGHRNRVRLYSCTVGREGDPRDVLAISDGREPGNYSPAGSARALWPELAVWLLGRRDHSMTRGAGNRAISRISLREVSGQRRAPAARRTACRPAHASTNSSARNRCSAPASRCAGARARASSTSLILWGPPCTGKTTLARLIARHADADFMQLSAVMGRVKDIREAVERARQARAERGRRSVLFLDEVHRFNKSQQDTFLPYVEDGTLTFIGATTENPSFEINSALLSRARVYVLRSLRVDDIVKLLRRALEDSERGLGKRNIDIADEAAGRAGAWRRWRRATGRSACWKWPRTSRSSATAAR
jgi:hypothetical protein